MTGERNDGVPARGARAWGEPAPGAADWVDGPAARLRPASRASRAPRTHASRLLRNAAGRHRPGAAPVPLPPGVRVVEDHHLDPATQARAWQELVDWVIWLHDAYELSVEERLPECWPAHPGLVAELAALKAWRTEIYQPPTDPGYRAATAAASASGNGGPARAWHTELRNVLNAAATVYAPGCRAGHRPAPRRLTNDPDVRATWLAQAPAPIVPHGTTAPGDSPASPRVISGTAMDDALRHGRARTLGPGLPGYAHHEGTWWAHAPDGTWLTVTDPALTTRLDQAATAIDRARTAADTGEPTR